VDEIQPLVAEVIVTIAVIGMGMLATYLANLLRELRPLLIAYIQTKIGAKQAEELDRIIGMGVGAARDAKVTGKIVATGESALAYAVRLAAEEAQRRGINVDAADLEAMARARYQREYAWLALQESVPETSSPEIK
jgi:hypothetical protein